MALVTPILGEESVVIPREKKEMLSVGRDAIGRTVVRINSSSLSIIQECMRKAQYSLNEGWTVENEPAATLFGRAVHKALEVFYRGLPEERVLPKYEHLEMMAYGHTPPPTNNDLVYRAVAAFIEVAQPLASLPETDKRSIQNGVWILYHYFKKFLDDPYITYCDEQGPVVERLVRFTLHEDPTLVVEYFGTIDLVLQHTVTREIYPVDHKTTSMITGYGDNSGFLEKDKPNHQYSGYLLGAVKALGINPVGFIVNVIHVKPKPKTARGSEPDFPRQVTTRNEDDFSDFRDSVMKAVRDYLYARDIGVWPQGPVSSCNLWGACTYKQVCSSPKSLRNTILNNKFVSRT